MCIYIAEGGMRKDSRRVSKMKGRISRIGSYAIASSIRDHLPHQQPCITCTTFNILAPIYKRLNHEDPSCRESDYRAYWLARNRSILDSLLNERSSIICLQEFWVGNEELVNLYEKRFGDAGYVHFKLGRTNNRGDGLLTAVHKDNFKVLNHRELLFNDCGDRVAQLLHVELAAPFAQCRTNDIRQEILIVNTHLLFPHDSSLCIVRLHQVYKILQCVESYQKENKLNPMPIILCGDWNGSKRGHVYKFLRSLGFESSYDTAHQYTDADAHKWVSHRNHRGNICGVDFIWLLNPNRYRNVVAALCVAPFAFYFERGNAKKLSWSIWFWLFLSALTGISMAMGLFYYGLRDTNATYATNFLNLIPIFTFVFSTILRIEKLGLKTRAGQVKTLGAIFCFAGALTTSLYKGKAFHIGHHSLHSTISLEPSEVHWTRGTFMLVGSCFSYAAWYIVQVKLLKIFPLRYLAIMLTCIIAAMQSVVIGLCINRQKAAWSLGWNLQLVTIFYSGALGTAVTFSLVSWAIAIRGPTYPPMFSPLTLICVALLEALILGAEIRLGSMLGTVLIIIGLYSFLWGKRKEMKSLKLVTKNDATGVIAPAATIPDESAVVQSTSILMPSPLSEYGVMDVQEDSDKSTLTPKLLMI